MIIIGISKKGVIITRKIKLTNIVDFSKKKILKTNKKYDFIAWDISLKHKDLLFNNQDSDIVYCRIPPNPFMNIYVNTFISNRKTR